MESSMKYGPTLARLPAQLNDSSLSSPHSCLQTILSSFPNPALQFPTALDWHFSMTQCTICSLLFPICHLSGFLHWTYQLQNPPLVSVPNRFTVQFFCLSILWKIPWNIALYFGKFPQLCSSSLWFAELWIFFGHFRLHASNGTHGITCGTPIKKIF